MLFYLAAACLAWLLWPTSLGGCTTLTIVSGHSMEPTYYTGDLVIARCGRPAVGDVIVYQPKGMGGARIIHRVIGGDAATGWTMKGDNNNFVDPFTPTGDQVLGVARVHVPKVGLVGSALTSPWIWASLMVLALALLVWPTKTVADDDPADDDIADREPASEDSVDDTEPPAIPATDDTPPVVLTTSGDLR